MLREHVIWALAHLIVVMALGFVVALIMLIAVALAGSQEVLLYLGIVYVLLAIAYSSKEKA